MVNLKLLRELREAWVNNRERIEGRVEMGTFFSENGFYCSQYYGCNTDCCLAGWGVVLLSEKENPYYFDASEFSNKVAPSTDLWHFLFSGFWPNSYDHALARMDYVLKHRKAPDNWDYTWQPTPEADA